MFPIKKWLISGFLITAFIAGCGILPIPSETTVPTTKTLTPIMETAVSENSTATPQSTSIPEESFHQLLSLLPSAHYKKRCSCRSKIQLLPPGIARTILLLPTHWIVEKLFIQFSCDGEFL